MILDEAKEWLSDAEAELLSARILLEHEGGKLALGLGKRIVEHCHDALEKLLKAIFITQNVRDQHPRIHDLSKLRSRCKFDSPVPDQISRTIDVVDDVAKKSRYPNSGTSSYLEDEKQIITLFRETEEAFKWLSQQLT